ncbi:xanthine and CO dehydrogenase maturation factor, XdhC/CoxF family [Serpentinimonas raichei]|uniref:Xanthine and CO dehydrogenase maturation factor, XdhC/CoxF family n=1 Tax=Serpentinimonas raichei TaxID=1458425 RepID=A0A060NL92_9BURK|nr:XdhC family protein [Serpentinimonas raichei]BAO82140.1 xanthine and CO dehydrogenase maturation factor, XdhC/CoxF family [Serpentinimonas raichei]
MNSLDIDVIRTALNWLSRGHRVVMGTVVRTWGSAPRPPGSLMIIRDDGQVAGSVSGGCIEDDLIRRVGEGELALHQPEITTYGQNAEEAHRFGLPCGGTVQIVLEPLSVGSGLRELLFAIESHRLVSRRLDITTGLVQLEDTTEADRIKFDGRSLCTVHGPRLRLLVIGGGQLARYLASMAVMLDYQVTVCEPREEYHEGLGNMAGVTLSTLMPDDLVLSMHLDHNSAVVAATHDPKLDDLALMEALRTPAFYVGALGSLHNNAKRRERLLEFDVSPEEIARLHGPVGLNLGALTPPEIAMSIVAEMTALRRGIDLSGPLSNWEGSKTVCAIA